MNRSEIETRFQKEIAEAIRETNVPCEVCFEEDAEGVIGSPAEQAVILSDGRHAHLTFVCNACDGKSKTWTNEKNEPITAGIFRFPMLSNK